ncbi:MAG: phage tail assembly chaperone [Pseudomonadota bacterium]
MLPWADLLRAALAAGLSPEVFWRLSVREWRWLSASGSAAPDRASLEKMMTDYPDRETGNG